MFKYNGTEEKGNFTSMKSAHKDTLETVKKIFTEMSYIEGDASEKNFYRIPRRQGSSKNS